MKEQVLFLNMFPDYAPPEELKEALSQAAIAAADIDPVRGCVEVAIHSPSYIPQLTLDTVADALRTAYGLRQMTITATHPASQLHSIQPEELMALFVRENSMNRGALAGATWTWEGQLLREKLSVSGIARQWLTYIEQTVG